MTTDLANTTIEALSPMQDLSFDAVIPGAHGRKRLQKGQTADIGSSNREQWMETERKNLAAYEYLCRIGEAKQWIEACIEEELGAITEVDELLRDGVCLAKLAKFFEPTCVKKIFMDPKLQYRHSDNTNFFFAACKKAGLPDLFIFELTDVYDKKNIPKVIYCIHALSHFLAKKGIAPKIKSLVGQLDFTQEELDRMENSLKEAGVQLPQFGNVEGALAKELNEETPEQKRDKYYNEHLEKIVKCQSYARMRSAQKAYQSKLTSLKENEAIFTKLQAHIRGYLARKVYKERLDYYKQQDNLERIIKVQAFVRGKVLGKAYKNLADSDDIPLQTIQSFIHLLDDSHFDFEEEMEVEKLKQEVIQRIRENNNLEQLLSDLDVKIALLVRNRITIDEVMKSSSKTSAKSRSRMSLASGGSSTNLLNNGGSTDNLYTSTNLKSLDKESRRRLELYQNLFYILQTHPKYLAKVVFLIKQTKLRAFMDHVLLTVYNFANSTREEYLLMGLFQCAIQEEMKHLSDVGDFLKGNPVFIKMVVHYIRGARERQFLRDLLQPLVKDVIAATKLDLETDPIAIYRQLIKDEESNTGEASKRPYDITREDALKDPEVQKVFEEHLKDLKAYTDKFLEALFQNLNNMPYGMRYIAKMLLKELREKFPSTCEADDDRQMKVIGNLIYYRYMNPAVVAPEGFDVIEQLISPLQRKNLAEISKMLQQISVEKIFEKETEYLSGLNDYINTSAKRMRNYFKEATEVPDAQDYFQISGFADATTTSKPVIYISPHELFNTHELLFDCLNDIAPDAKDPLRAIMKELGPTPPGSVTVDYSGQGKEISEDEKRKTANEISLVLSSRFLDNEMESATPGGHSGLSFKNLFLETKRLVLLLIRVQSGKSLLEIIEKPITPQEVNVYKDVVAAEKKRESEVTPPSPVDASMASLDALKPTAPVPEVLEELKKVILVNLEQLEKLYNDFDDQVRAYYTPVIKSNNYQGVLTAIGLDIRNKHRRRIQRKAEIRSLLKTVANLADKMKYLEDQKQSYHDYINSCMAQLTNSRKKQNAGSGKFVMPFTPQWNHQQDLKKQGKVPQFGSFKYTADALFKKGVLLSVEGQSVKNFDKISLTISSDESGLFDIEAVVSVMGVPMHQKMELKLDDLLQYQFENQHVISLFDGAAKANVNLLIYLINKKFYK